MDSTSTSTKVEKLTPITPLDTRCWNLRVGNLHKIELTKSTFLILRAGLALIRRDDVPKPGEFISRCRGLHQMHQPRTATQIFRSSCRSYQIRKLSWLAFLLLMQHWYYGYITPLPIGRVVNYQYVLRWWCKLGSRHCGKEPKPDKDKHPTTSHLATRWDIILLAYWQVVVVIFYTLHQEMTQPFST